MDDHRDPARLIDGAGLLAGVALGTASITLLFLGMRAVMDIGGACADGGPYVPARPCPEGVGLVMFGGMLGLFASGGLIAWFGSRLGARYASLVLLGWPALFLSLGWNFLEYGIAPPGGGGLEWGWLVPGVMFVLMGGVPLVLGIAAVRAGRGQGSLDRLRSVRRTSQTDSPWAAATVGMRSDGTAVPAHARADPPGSNVVDDLERLSALHRAGAIDDAEFAAAKRRVLGGEGPE